MGVGSLYGASPSHSERGLVWSALCGVYCMGTLPPVNSLWNVVDKKLITCAFDDLHQTLRFFGATHRFSSIVN